MCCGLSTEPPLRVVEHCRIERCVLIASSESVHRLQQEISNEICAEFFGRRVRLRVNQLEFVPLKDSQIAGGFRADANPVNSRRRHQRSVGLDGDFKSAFVQFEPGHRRPGAKALRRSERRTGCVRQPPIPLRLPPRDPGGPISSSLGAVGPDEVGVAEMAHRAVPILLATGPEIAARETAEHRRPADMRALALQGKEYFLHGKVTPKATPLSRGYRRLRMEVSS